MLYIIIYIVNRAPLELSGSKKLASTMESAKTCMAAASTSVTCTRESSGARSSRMTSNHQRSTRVRKIRKRKESTMSRLQRGLKKDEKGL